MSILANQESAIAIEQKGDVLVVDSRLIALQLGVEHETFVRTIKKYETKIEQRFGCIRFEIGVPDKPTGNPPKFAWLGDRDCLRECATKTYWGIAV